MSDEQHFTLDQITQQIFDHEGVLPEIHLYKEHYFTRSYRDIFPIPAPNEHKSDVLLQRINQFIQICGKIVNNDIISLEAVRFTRGIRNDP
jgi:hypothetical protein